MADMEKVIKGLEFTKAMITFNPSTGEDIEPGSLNDANKTSYDACVGAIALLKEQEAEIDEISDEYLDLGNEIAKMPNVIRCKDCIHYRYYGLAEDTVSECTIDHCENPDKEWFCADGRRKNGEVE